MQSVDTTPVPVTNRVILATRPEAQAFIGERMVTRPVAAGTVLYEAGEPFTHAVFPQIGVISLLGEGSDGRGVEKASIGNEGFLGFTYLMGGSGSVSKTIVQVPGYVSWLTLSDLDEAMERFVCVREAMLRYAKALIVQLMETVVCNSLHTAEQRVSRWLLHAHDRMMAQEFPLTQEALSRVLGLRRATVSEICSDLMRAGVITYSRGIVSITEPEGLVRHSCGCYARVVQASIQPRKD